MNQLVKIFTYIYFSLQIVNGGNLDNFKTYNGNSSEIVRWNFGNFIHPENSSVKYALEIYSPTHPGTYDVIIFLGGFDGIIPSFIYQDYNTKLAQSTNRIVVFLGKLGFIKLPNKEENLLELTLNWTLPNLYKLFNDKNTPSVVKGKVIPNVETRGVTLLTHSSSGHSVVSYLNKTCGMITSLILLDPVDGYDPFNFIKIYITNPPKQLPFTIPTLIISNGLDAMPANSLFPACAPDNTSNLRFYDSLPGPTVLLNFTSYGHADILDEWIREVAGRVCHQCISDCDYELYKTNEINAIKYFLLAVEEGNGTYLNALENPSNQQFFDPRIKMTSIQKYNGYNILETGRFCKHS